MKEERKPTGAPTAPSLIDKLEQYYTEQVGNIIGQLEKLGVSKETQQVYLIDVWKRLSYTDREMKANRQQVEDLARHIRPADKFVKHLMTSPDTFSKVAIDYLWIDKLLTMADELKKELKETGNVEQEGLNEKAKKMRTVFNSMTYTAQEFVLNNLPEEVVLNLKDKDRCLSALVRYISFIYQAITYVNASDEELLQIEPECILDFPENIKVETIQQVREGMIHRRSQEIYDRGTSGGNATLRAEKEGPEAAIPARLIKLWQNVVDACSGPLMLVNEAKAEANQGGEEIRRESGRHHPAGVYSLKTAIAKAQETIDREAREQNRPAIKLSEERVYQCLNGLQVLANEYGQPRAGKDGVDYFEYATSLRKIASVCYGNENPNAELIRQTYESLRVLATNYVAIEEKRVKNVRIDAENGQKITKPTVKTYRHFIQLVVMPQITLRTNPDGTVNNDIGEATATVWVHSVLRTGRRQSAPVINNGKKEYIQLPQAQYITYEAYEHSLRFFKSQDGSGRRFFSMILAKNHKAEEDILSQVFDYDGKIEKAKIDAEKRAKKRQSKQINESGTIEYLANLFVTGTTSEELISQEVSDAEKKIKRSISKNKARDRDTLALWFSQAVELNVIEPDPVRRASKTKPGSYVWEWVRKKPKEI